MGNTQCGRTHASTASESSLSWEKGFGSGATTAVLLLGSNWKRNKKRQQNVCVWFVSYEFAMAGVKRHNLTTGYGH